MSKSIEQSSKLLEGRTDRELSQLDVGIEEELSKYLEGCGRIKIVEVDLPEGIVEVGFKDGLRLRTTGVR